MRMTPIKSSAIARVGYEDRKRVLRLEYTGGATYDYFGVPPKAHCDLWSAASAGEFVNREIKPRYRYTQVR
jgi:hypothetical protein